MFSVQGKLDLFNSGRGGVLLPPSPPWLHTCRDQFLSVHQIIQIKTLFGVYSFPIITLSVSWLMGGIHVPIATQSIILTFSFQPTYPPLTTSNAEVIMFIRNTNPLAIRDTLKVSYFFISKDFACFHRQENKIRLYC